MKIRSASQLAFSFVHTGTLFCFLSFVNKCGTNSAGIRSIPRSFIKICWKVPNDKLKTSQRFTDSLSKIFMNFFTDTSMFSSFLSENDRPEHLSSSTNIVFSSNHLNHSISVCFTHYIFSERLFQHFMSFFAVFSNLKQNLT